MSFMLFIQYYKIKFYPVVETVRTVKSVIIKGWCISMWDQLL